MKMKNGMPPKEKSEKTVSQNAAGREKYGTEFGNGEALEKSTRDLVGFVKKKKMKY